MRRAQSGEEGLTVEGIPRNDMFKGPEARERMHVSL